MYCVLYIDKTITNGDKEKKDMKKRLFSGFLALMMVFTLVNPMSFTARADENTVEETQVQSDESTVEETQVQSDESTVEETQVQSDESTVGETQVQSDESTVEETQVQSGERVLLERHRYSRMTVQLMVYLRMCRLRRSAEPRVWMLFPEILAIQPKTDL